MDTSCLKRLIEALRLRHTFFARMGARATDHGLLEPYGLEVEPKRAEQIFWEAYEPKYFFSIQSVEVKNLFPI